MILALTDFSPAQYVAKCGEAAAIPLVAACFASFVSEDGKGNQNRRCRLDDCILINTHRDQSPGLFEGQQWLCIVEPPAITKSQRRKYTIMWFQVVVRPATVDRTRKHNVLRGRHEHKSAQKKEYLWID